MGLDERVSLAKHSQNPQPLPKLGILIHPAATIHIGCLSVTGKQLPKPSRSSYFIFKAEAILANAPKATGWSNVRVYIAE